MLEVGRGFVLRNGQNVAQGPAQDFDAASLTRHMTGRDVPEARPPLDIDQAETLLVVDSLGKEGAFDDISFALKAGEVLGISGVLGSGRTSLAKALFGLVAPDQGSISLSGANIPLGNPIASTQAGIGYVPEDRPTEGLFLTQSIIRNVFVGRFDHHHRSGGFLDLASLADGTRRDRTSSTWRLTTRPVKSLSVEISSVLFWRDGSRRHCEFWC